MGVETIPSKRPLTVHNWQNFKKEYSPHDRIEAVDQKKLQLYYKITIF